MKSFRSIILPVSLILALGTPQARPAPTADSVRSLSPYFTSASSGALAPDADGFLRRTFVTSGKAILFNAASVAAGFAVLAFSRFLMLAFFGTLIALTMVTSALVSLTVLPALLRTIDPAFIRRPLPFERAAPAKEQLK